MTVKKRTDKLSGINKSLTFQASNAYTFSAYVKGTGTGTTVTRFVFVNGVENTNLRKNWTSAFDWTRDYVTLDLKANDIVIVRYDISVLGTNSAVWTAGHKWEQGSIATLYIPSASEVMPSDYPSYTGWYVGKIVDGQSSDPTKYNWEKI